MNIVSRVATPLNDPVSAANLFVDVYTSFFGQPPSRQEAELLMAHTWGIENGRGKSIIVFNWGNLSAGPAYQGDAWRPPWYELTPDSSDRMKALHELMLQNKAPSAFRAYPDHRHGLTAYFQMLQNKFPSVLSAARTGDAMQMAGAVFHSGYCPDEGCKPEHLGPSLESLQNEFDKAGLFARLTSLPLVGPMAAGSVVPWPSEPLLPDLDCSSSRS